MNINLKHTFLLAAFACASTAWASAPKSLQQWGAEGAQMSREGDNLFSVAFTLDMERLNVPSEEALLFTPVLYQGTDSVELPAVGVYGRNRFYHYERRGEGMISGMNETVLKNREKPSELAYSQIISYQPWMSGAYLKVRCDCYGCCFQLEGQNQKLLSRFVEANFPIEPTYVYQPGDAEIVGELSGEARVQFVVDRWELHQDKFSNAPELAKILHSIDTIKSDKDLTVTEIWLKGFASPEATWQHNAMLAQNRTQAVRKFVEQRYDFDPSVFVTEFQPEDWEGLRRWVAESNLDNRDAILAIIDEPVVNPDTDWDAKEMKLRQKFPAERKFLLNTVYPPLRHTEYKIKYKVRKFINPEDVREVMRTDPSKLTINDFHVAATGYEPGTPEFNEVYDIMVRLYPESEIANLNAANAALQSGTLADAQRFLAKAGNSPEADFSRALYKILTEDYAGALPLMQQAAANGINGAPELLEHLQEYLKWNP